MKLLPLCLTLTIGVAIGGAAERMMSVPQAEPKRHVLLRVPLEEMGGKEMRMWISEIAPGAVTPKHFHPGHVLGYVLEGTVVHNFEGKPPLTLHAGEAWQEAGADVHFGQNPSAMAPVRLLVVQIADKGQPIIQPVK